MASALRTVLAATTLGAAVALGAASAAGASPLANQGLGLPDLLPTPDLGTPDLQDQRLPSSGAPTSELLTSGWEAPAETLPSPDGVTGQLGQLGQLGQPGQLGQDGSRHATEAVPHAPGGGQQGGPTSLAGDQLVQSPADRGGMRPVTVQPGPGSGLDGDLSQSVPSAVNTMSELNLNPLSGGGFNPLDNSVGLQAADFKPVSTAQATGELAHGASLKDLTRF